MPPIFVGLPSKGEQIESLSSFFTDSAIKSDGELSDILVTAAVEATKLFSQEDTKGSILKKNILGKLFTNILTLNRNWTIYQ